MAKLPTKGKKEEVKEEKATKKNSAKTAKPEPKEEVKEEKGKRGRKASTPEEKAAKAAEAPAENEHVDPESFVYTVKAGKTYTGFSYGEMLDFVAGVSGKVAKVIIIANPK